MIAVHTWYQPVGSDVHVDAGVESRNHSVHDTFLQAQTCATASKTQFIKQLLKTECTSSASNQYLW